MPGAPCLRVDNLSVVASADRNGGASPAGLNFVVEAGEQVAVVGPPGSGKTAVLRTLALMQRSAGGGVTFEGDDILRWSGKRLRDLRRRLQFVGGDPSRTLPPHFTILEAMREPFRVHRIDPAEEQRRLEDAAALFGLQGLLWDRPISSLSAAVRQKVLLARALALQPSLLITDELVERLDAAAARPLLERLSRACRLRRAAWLWATSDAALAEAFSDRTLRLEAGRLVAAGA